MSTDHVELRSGAYADSVTLLQVSRQVQQQPGVETAQVAMATPLNVEVLERMRFAIPDDATVNHLVVAVRLEDADALDAVLVEVDRALSDSRRQVAGPSEEAPPRTRPPRIEPKVEPARWCWSRSPARVPRSRPWTPSRPAAT